MAKPGRLSERVAQSIREDIVAGVYPPGARIPSHRVLTKRYGVHQETVARAIHLLVRDGLLIGGQRHEGVYVAHVQRGMIE